METKQLRPSLLITLYKLTELGAYPDEILFTTGQLAKTLSFSQQTASRHLIELERLGLIKRTRIARRETIQVTKGGANHLNNMFLTLKRVFEVQTRQITVEGKVFSGLGEGAYYMSQTGYRKQFKEKLGFDPFPGTLNLRVRPERLEDIRILETCPFVLIEGFVDQGRSFGPAKCYRAVVNERVEGAIISPVRTHYEGDVAELIARENLRKVFRLHDGDMVRARAVISVTRQASA